MEIAEFKLSPDQIGLYFKLASIARADLDQFYRQTTNALDTMSKTPYASLYDWSRPDIVMTPYAEHTLDKLFTQLKETLNERYPIAILSRTQVLTNSLKRTLNKHLSHDEHQLIAILPSQSSALQWFQNHL